MNVNVLDIFYNNIVPEATTGRIDCYYYYNMVFSTKILSENIEYVAKVEEENLLIPTLIIKDKPLFDKLLLEYVELALNFYDSISFDFEILNYKAYDDRKKICNEKVILALLFANATVEDFNNPCDFLRKRIDFFKNNSVGFYNLGFSETFKGEVYFEIDTDTVSNETPYQIIIRVLSNDGEVFEFPRVKFGICDDNVYIYAIQNKFLKINSFSKKINRILYKIGEGYKEESIDNNEDLKDVTSSFIVCLNMCISYFSTQGYKNIVVPSCLVERWNAKSIANSLRVTQRKMDDIQAFEISKIQDEIQNNLTNKLIRTCLRLGCHYNNIDVLSFPYELDSCLHIKINDNILECNNSLLYDTYKLVEHGLTKKTYGK